MQFADHIGQSSSGGPSVGCSTEELDFAYEQEIFGMHELPVRW
jgi:hypothetical protein